MLLSMLNYLLTRIPGFITWKGTCLRLTYYDPVIYFLSHRFIRVYQEANIR